MSDFNHRDQVEQRHPASALEPLFSAAAQIMERAWYEPREPLLQQWYDRVRVDGSRTLDLLISWEEEQVARLGLDTDLTRLDLVRRMLAERGDAPVVPILHEDTTELAASFDPTNASEPAMALTVCGLWWRARLTRALVVVASCPLEPFWLDRDPNAIDIPSGMWDLVTAGSPDPWVYVPLLADVIYANTVGAEPALYTERVNTLRDRVTPVADRFARARTARDFQADWLRVALLGGLPYSDGHRPGLAALLWVAETGLMAQLWPAIRAQLQRIQSEGTLWSELLRLTPNSIEF